MNRHLLAGASALALLAAAPAAHAQFTTTFSGDLWVDYGYTSVSNNDARTALGLAANAPIQQFNSQQRGRFNLISQAKADNGLTYGIRYRIRLGATGDTVDHDKSYIFAQGAFGRVEIGRDDSATANVVAPASAWGLSGADGFAYDFAPGAEPAPATYASVISTRNMTRVNYYTPRFAGIQGTISYATNAGANDAGRTLNFNQVASTYNDYFELGLNFDETFQGIRVRAAVSYTGAENTVATNEDLEAWFAYARLDYAGAAVSAHYINNGQYNTVRGAPNRRDETGVVLMAQYTFGAFTVGASYAHWEANSTAVATAGSGETTHWAIGASYVVAPGLSLRPEISFIEWDRPGALRDVDSTIFALRTQINF